jgi:hypothetical protein
MAKASAKMKKKINISNVNISGENNQYRNNISSSKNLNNVMAKKACEKYRNKMKYRKRKRRKYQRAKIIEIVSARNISIENNGINSRKWRGVMWRNNGGSLSNGE